jgi:hypothetical protein
MPSIEQWQHPLIRTLERPMSRRLLALGTLGLAASAPSLRLVSAAAQDASPEASPASQITGADDAVALLEASASAMAKLETFAFELETTRGSSTILQGLELKGIEGVVRRPADIEATLTVSVPFGDFKITAIGVNGSYWVQDPLSDGAWLELGTDVQINSIINPDALILMAVRLVRNASITGTEKVDGVDTTMVEGTVDFYAVANDTFGDSTMLEGLVAEGEKDIIFWIDDQNRIVEAEIIGPLLASESEDVARLLSLYDFDEPVEIEAPPASTPVS